jgi:hypothetical protein
MYISEKYKESIRRYIKAEVERGTGPITYWLGDWVIYNRVWDDLKNEMCRRAGVVGAVTANMVTERLHMLMIRRVSRYDRPWVI